MSFLWPTYNLVFLMFEDQLNLKKFLTNNLNSVVPDLVEKYSKTAEHQ